MKKHIIIAAISLLVASPAAAQTAPAANPHQGHDMGQMQGHDMSQMQHGQTSGQHSQHQGHNMQGDCCADRNGNGRIDCCENMPAGQHQGHQAQPQPQPSPNR